MVHSFDVDIAIKYGVETAILIQHFGFWHIENKAAKTNLHEGTYWTYNVVKAFSNILPCYNNHQIRRILRNMEAQELIKKKRLSDRTAWYALTYKGQVELNIYLTY